jgi:O-methyltransferase involved in polyketide biosynthesis
MTGISRDIYAHLWVTPEAVSRWNELSAQVYPHDDLNVSLRNRFYLDHIEAFVASQRRPFLVNIATGFDNYPFLIRKPCGFLQLDRDNIIGLKKRRVTQWMRSGKLPRRRIRFLATDLNDRHQQAVLKRTLARTVGNRPCFVTMEGITYYLHPETLERLFAILREVLTAGSLVALDYWKPDAMKYPVMVRLRKLLDRQFGCRGQRWNLLEHRRLCRIPGFTEIESTDIAALERKHSSTRIFRGNAHKIPVFFSVLKRA